MNKRIALVLALTFFMAGAAHAQVQNFTIDPTHTFVTFEVDHFATSTNRGRFDKKDGVIQIDTQGKVGVIDVTFDPSSVNTGTVAFDKHLQGADFFDVARHPTVRFVSEKIEFDGEKVAQVHGRLTMLGQTHPLTLKATKFNCFFKSMIKRDVCGGDFEASLARSQWGMNWGLNLGFTDRVKLLVQVEAIKQP